MGMVGEYARLTPAELGRALGGRFVYEMIEDGGSARCMDVDKAWDTLRFLLGRVGFPVDIVRGEEEIPGADDFGYTPPRYLSPERVRVAATALGPLPADVLVRGVTMADLAAADLYPELAGQDPDWLQYVTHHYDALVPFFQAAAAAGDAVVIWLD
ncbi:YfbM family protein [Streptomyces sp. CA-111067]|uniref:YfbM family protein n=1 Tax=Streptomyces sp. CA-111067 TaxID=3240046 RepID=UPI003D959270